MGFNYVNIISTLNLKTFPDSDVNMSNTDPECLTFLNHEGTQSIPVIAVSPQCRQDMIKIQLSF